MIKNRQCGLWVPLNYPTSMHYVLLYLQKYQSKKDQELIQSNTRPDLGHHMGKVTKHKKTSHTRKPRGKPLSEQVISGLQ